MGKRINLPPGALGMFEKLGVRLAFRKAKLVRGQKEGTVVRQRPGASDRVPGRRISQEESWQRAADARDALITRRTKARHRIAELKSKPKRDLTKAEGRELDELQKTYSNKRSIVTGATDPESGVSGAGLSGGTPRTSGYPDSWKCAERAAFEDVNDKRIALGYPPTTPDRLEYSHALDLKNGGQKPIDGACQEQIPPFRFPDGTRYYLTGDNPGWP